MRERDRRERTRVINLRSSGFVSSRRKPSQTLVIPASECYENKHRELHPVGRVCVCVWLSLWRRGNHRAPYSAPNYYLKLAKNKKREEREMASSLISSSSSFWLFGTRQAIKSRINPRHSSIQKRKRKKRTSIL